MLKNSSFARRNILNCIILLIKKSSNLRKCKKSHRKCREIGLSIFLNSSLIISFNWASPSLDSCSQEAEIRSSVT